MIFYCVLEFKNTDQPSERSDAKFIMNAKGWNDIQKKLALCSEAPIFHGWNIIKTYATLDRIEGLSGCFCTYSKQRGFKGTFSMLPRFMEAL